MTNSLLNICRACMKTDVVSLNIFQPQASSDCKISQVAEAIMECAPVQVQQNDNLPDKICSQCLEQLESFQEFREQIIRTDSLLRKICTNREINVEITDLTDAFTEQDICTAADHTNEFLPNVSPQNGDNCEQESVLTFSDRETLNAATPTFLRRVKLFKSSNVEFSKLQVARNRSKQPNPLSQPNKTGRVKRQGPHKCDFCDKYFKSYSNLVVHRRVHTKERPFICDVCGKSFAGGSALVTHRRLHTGDLRFACDICGKRFNQKCGMEEHRRSHTGERPFACDVCGKTYTQASHLHAHKRFHTGERPFSCEFCEKRFTTGNDVKKHRRVHTGERPYQCDICNRKFTQHASLSTHKKLVHKPL